MNLQVLKEAEDELNEAIAYYEEIEPGLGALSKKRPSQHSNGFAVILNYLAYDPKGIGGSI